MSEQPLLVYDGDCGICRYWVEYWRRITRARVRYAPLQSLPPGYAGVSEAEFRGAIQLFLPDGSRYSGAEAVFRLLAPEPGYAHWLWLHNRLPGFGRAAQAGYQFFAGRRGWLTILTRLLWGRAPQPSQYRLVCRAFLLMLGLCYLAAFFSLGTQVSGLLGAEGILGAADYFSEARTVLGHVNWWQMPTLFWLNSSDTALQLACLAGGALAGMVVLGFYTRTALAGCYLLYLSLLYAGQLFMRFQWDILLLECGLLGLLLHPRVGISIFLYRWLLFRVMFFSGVVKIVSGDPTWDNLTALQYHYQTQPLPTPLAWYFHHLPDGFHVFCTGLTLFIELALPFLIFAPRQLRRVAAGSFILLQVTILLTGNYNFFNLLILALCLLLFDDHDLRRCAALLRAPPADRPGRAARVFTTLAACILIAASIGPSWRTFHPGPPDALTTALRPLVAANRYGPFAVMTTERPELIVEGSMDGRDWLPYEFRHKPGDPARGPGWNVPMQPRLDWQLWFAALSSYGQQPWIGNLVYRLLRGSKPVETLFAATPFAEPPTWVRISLYRYRFTTPGEYRATGHRWHREYLGLYLPPQRLRMPPAGATRLQ